MKYRRSFVLRRMTPYKFGAVFIDYLVEAHFDDAGIGWQGTGVLAKATRFGRHTAHLLSSLLPATEGNENGERYWEVVEVEPAAVPE